nr:MAG TPA: hypothetical protein [Caudoviricetes sp.]
MDKDFSEGFLHDIADLLKECVKHNTDNVDITFSFGDRKMTMNITFSVKQTDI